MIPHSIESEWGLLGSLLADNAAATRISGLDPTAFYVEFHQDIYRAMLQQVAAGKVFDIITLHNALSEAGKADDESLMALNEIAQYVTGARNVVRYAEIVSDHHRKRQLLAASDEIAEIAQGKGTPAEQVDRAQMVLAKLATVKAQREPQHINQSLADYLTLLQDLSEGKNPAIPTGIAGLDRILNGGLRRGGMMVIGARPKHGKTALALALARNMARQYTVLFLSQEMSVMELMHRHTAAMSSIDLGRIVGADASDQPMWQGVTEAAHRLGKLKLVHDEQCALNLLDIRRKAMSVRRQHGLDVLFVDFLQLMQGAGEENRNRELDVIVNGIKALAMDLQIAVVVMSQMSRKADESYHRPTMTHLRDSGAIEAAADQIALLFNDHAHPLSKKGPDFKGFSELEIVAHRNGPQGLVPLHFAGELQQFSDWAGPIPKRGSRNSGDFE
ncbi:replicative DNA helicase [Rhodoferax sediminis]|uniref:DNA 5'-3' helicase n=1 Tax=Rhodoferax sediminis TaxID=2509614 RepID=A0A515DG00_9BURK|nr:DnaB-like helicase C-terminal domain-containing protein [Rhodoferax sediminis]QDL39333.1 helicase DnaB [Rhodoferax sediminis]